MADPRLDVSVVGIAAEYAAFLIDNVAITYDATKSGGSSSVGLAVTLSAANTVSTVAAAEAVLGKLVEVFKDNTCTVQISGGMTLPGGAALTGAWGAKIVGDVDGAAAEGYIRDVDTSAAAELGVARGLIADAGTTTAVEVIL